MVDDTASKYLLIHHTPFAEIFETKELKMPVFIPVILSSIQCAYLECHLNAGLPAHTLSVHDPPPHCMH